MKKYKLTAISILIFIIYSIIIIYLNRIFEFNRIEAFFCIIFSSIFIMFIVYFLTSESE